MDPPVAARDARLRPPQSDTERRLRALQSSRPELARGSAFQFVSARTTELNRSAGTPRPDTSRRGARAVHKTITVERGHRVKTVEPLEERRRKTLRSNSSLDISDTVSPPSSPASDEDGAAGASAGGARRGGDTPNRTAARGAGRELPAAGRKVERTGSAGHGNAETTETSARAAQPQPQHASGRRTTRSSAGGAAASARYRPY